MRRLAVALFVVAALACERLPEPPASEGDAGPGDASVPATPAFVRITEPAEEAPVATTLLTVRGEAGPGTRRVEVLIDDTTLVRAAGTTSWSAVLRLAPGRHRLEAIATGAEGSAENVRIVHQGRTVTLRPLAQPQGDVELRLDRFALERLIPAQKQAEVTLTYLDLQPLIENALSALADPVGWGVDTTAWGPAERNLARLLSMSPDTADVSGTSLAPVMDLSRRLGLNPARLLSDLLDQSPTDPFFARSTVAESLLDGLIRSHPNYEGDAEGRLPVTLQDALTDLSTLSKRYGPVDDHPGFIAAPPQAELLTPAFAMVVRGRGNARFFAGLRPGEGYASHVVLAPGEPILDLDFNDPDRFRLEGLAPEPRVALAMRVVESPDQFVPGGPPGEDPRGTSAVFDAPPWVLERIIAETAYRAFATRFPAPRTLEYDLGALSPAATLTWIAGWVAIEVVADLGPPPAPAYIWELILDVAQRRLHDGGIAEGEASVTLVLPPLGIGLDAEGLVTALRPVLHAQRETLVELMLGGAEDLESRATLWLDPSEPGAPKLRVVDGAPRLFDSASLTGTGSDEAALGSEPTVLWTRSVEGARYALLIGAWDGERVDIGWVEVPE